MPHRLGQHVEDGVHARAGSVFLRLHGVWSFDVAVAVADDLPQGVQRLVERLLLQFLAYSRMQAAGSRPAAPRRWRQLPGRRHRRRRSSR